MKYEESMACCLDSPYHQNIAGSRESKAQWIQERVKNVIVLALRGKVYPIGVE